MKVFQWVKKEVTEFDPKDVLKRVVKEVRYYGDEERFYIYRGAEQGHISCVLTVNANQLGESTSFRILSKLNKDMQLGVEAMIEAIIEKDLINDIEIVL